jgi:hypothetical protein
VFVCALREELPSDASQLFGFACLARQDLRRDVDEGFSIGGSNADLAAMTEKFAKSLDRSQPRRQFNVAVIACL